MEQPKRLKPWWFVNEQGKLCFSVRYGTQVIELAKGKFSIGVADESALISALEMVKQTVEHGELDAQSTPQVSTHDECLNQDYELSKHMLIREVTKPPSPQQQRVNQLRTQLDAARRAARVARLNQQQQRVNQQRIKLSETQK